MIGTQLNTAQRKAIRLAGEEVADNIIFKKDGTIEFRHGYFYTFGMNEDKLTTRVEKCLKHIGFRFSAVKSENKFQHWPKDSWFSVTGRVTTITA